MNPGLEFVPSQLLARLTTAKPYLVLILKKGKHYDQPDSRKIIQSEHLPYLFELRDKGFVDISIPVSGASEITAIAIINSVDIIKVRQLIDNDPAVKAAIFTYELLNGMGLKGDHLK